MMDQAGSMVRKLMAQYPENLKPFQSIISGDYPVSERELESSDLIPLIQQLPAVCQKAINMVPQGKPPGMEPPDKKEQILNECMVCLEKIGLSQA